MLRFPWVSRRDERDLECCHQIQASLRAGNSYRTRRRSSNRLVVAPSSTATQYCFILFLEPVCLPRLRAVAFPRGGRTIRNQSTHIEQLVCATPIRTDERLLSWPGKRLVRGQSGVPTWLSA